MNMFSYIQVLDSLEPAMFFDMLELFRSCWSDYFSVVIKALGRQISICLSSCLSAFLSGVTLEQVQFDVSTRNIKHTLASASCASRHARASKATRVTG
jgi:hypothetical protein